MSQCWLDDNKNATAKEKRSVSNQRKLSTNYWIVSTDLDNDYVFVYIIVIILQRYKHSRYHYNCLKRDEEARKLLGLPLLEPRLDELVPDIKLLWTERAPGDTTFKVSLTTKLGQTDIPIPEKYIFNIGNFGS